ncbi:hypothetical protein ACFQFH_01625 [Halobaculum halobium]|uniref:PglZ domain-containing protein n=1 Tax=Halobaculum halobium TaxID=3032281 RepID=A0ABD5TAV7_9EURY|nr:hypothetical protein [Halobaculum sp. SYNS20]
MDLANVVANLRRNWDDPSWWRDIVVPFGVRTALVQPYFRHLASNDGVRVLDEDWDTLLILDACRYDMFVEHNTIEGDLSRRTSLGSNTEEFLVRNFRGGTFDDVVYVTANPQVDVRLDDPFHEVVSVWRDEWDEEFDTVMPDAMADAVREAAEAYPNKRIVGHFVQPHYPFVGERGRELLDEQAGIELSRRMADGDEPIADHMNVWDMLQRGLIDERDLRAAYEENLRIALPHVRTLVEDLEGRTVVTSDHGNLIGERPKPCPVPMELYGHPPGVYADSLVTVPWLTVEGEGRRRIVTGSASVADDTASSNDAAAAGAESGQDEDEATDRLRDLGYLE